MPGVDAQHKKLSLKFYSYLCDIIGTAKVVHKRRQIMTVFEDILSLGGRTIICGGSRADGFDFEGSDYDLLTIITKLALFERFDQVKLFDDKVTAIIDTENVKPGYAKVLIHHPQNSDLTYDITESRSGLSYLSSKQFLEKLCFTVLAEMSGVYIHGPCATACSGKLDWAVSLHCGNWISQALSWITRSKYSWASDTVIQNILSFGVLLVPIGVKHSEKHTQGITGRDSDIDVEWRISFNYAEKHLIFSFNHVQFLCYALLKIVLKDIIQDTFEDSTLCSYFMKTIMFWLCEETETSFWRADNILSCFMTCYRRLIYCVENKTCLHYFIPDNNLFEKRIEKQHKNLLSFLHRLHDFGWTFLLRAKTFKSFRDNFDPVLSLNMPLATYLPCLEQLLEPYFDRNLIPLIKRSLYWTIRSKKDSDILMFLTSRVYQGLAEKVCDHEAGYNSNKTFYRHSRQIVSHLLVGINHDAVSGWLLLASYFFKSQQYSVYKILIDHCFSKFTPGRCSLYFKKNRQGVLRFNQIHEIVGLKWLKHYTINVVKFTNDSAVIPVEVKSYVGNDPVTYVPSNLYASLLNLIFYQTFGNERQRKEAYYNLLNSSCLYREKRCDCQICQSWQRM